LKTLIVGLGNPILGDDGVGWHIARQVKQQLLSNHFSDDNVIVECLSLGGLSLMEQLIGYERAIIIDAINLGDNPVGHVYCFPLEDLPNHATGHMSSSHDTSLQNALEVGRSMEAQLPDQITIVGIESPYVYDFSEELSPSTAAAVPEAVKIVMHVLLKGECNERKENLQQ
jgi:hydrogenase maturation protease